MSIQEIICPEKSEEHVCTQISRHNKIDKKKIPLLTCSCSSPFAIDAPGYHTFTIAYNIQCWHHSAKTLIKYIQTTYINAPTFIFHKLHHQDFNAYCNSIRKQESNHHIIPIKGISPDTIFYLKMQLLQID